MIYFHKAICPIAFSLIYSQKVQKVFVLYTVVNAGHNNHLESKLENLPTYIQNILLFFASEI